MARKKKSATDFDRSMIAAAQISLTFVEMLATEHFRYGEKAVSDALVEIRGIYTRIAKNVEREAREKSE